MPEPIHLVGDARVLAALNVLGWPDDREMSAHVEPDGYHITPAGLYWEIVSEVLVAADLADAPLPDDVQRTAGLMRAAATMYGDEDVLAAADLVEWQSLEIARLRRMPDSARHVGVEAAATHPEARTVTDHRAPTAAAIQQLAAAIRTAFPTKQIRQLHADAVNEQDAVTHRDPWMHLVDALFIAGWPRDGQLQPTALDEIRAQYDTARDALKTRAEAAEALAVASVPSARAQGAAERPTTPPEGERVAQTDPGVYSFAVTTPQTSGIWTVETPLAEPAQALPEVDTLIWDWKEQPDLDDLAAILARHGVRLTQVDNGTDEYEILISSADQCPNLAQVLATDTGSHDDSVCGWCADLRTKREAARGRLRTLVFNAITRTLAGRTFVPLGAREDVARAVVDALECDADNRSAQ